MGLQQCGLNLNHARQELQPHGTPAFPCAGYASSHRDTLEDRIPWHWHEELEIIYIREGTMRLQVPSEQHLLQAGELAFLNGGLPHEAEGAPFCALQSLVFSPLLVAGGYTSAVFEKYVRPLLACPAFTFIPDRTPEMCGRFRAAFDALAKDEPGYEMLVQEQLTGMLRALFLALRPAEEAPARPLTADTLRLEQMLTHIHEHFAEDLELRDIAAAGRVGERECLRCFRRTIGESPMQYLIKYRLMRGAERLLTEPAASVSEIAGSCGFSYVSYFAKQFRRFYQCSPREYRQRAETERRGVSSPAGTRPAEM